MLTSRVLVALLLLPIGLAVIYAGGWVFSGFFALVLALAAWEYVRLFHTGGFCPSGIFVVAGTAGLALARTWNGFESGPWMLSLLVLAAMAVHLISFERGRDLAATDFGITVAGILYFGWVGSYLISLRELPEGLYWMLIALPAVWAADSGAYIFGRRFGRRRLSPRLSPKKTWEGYIGGVATGTLFGALLGAGFQALAGPGTLITPLRGALLAFVLGTLTVFGDLGESMVKRQVGAKDSGKLLPGHGGVFDRIDSWLWAGVLSYYLIVWFFVP